MKKSAQILSDPELLAKFVGAYRGDGTEMSALMATGLKFRNQKSKNNAALEVLADPRVKKLLKNSTLERFRGLAIATRQERQQFWTHVMMDEDVKMEHRLRASELLGRSEGDFIDKVKLETSQDMAVLIAKAEARMRRMVVDAEYEEVLGENGEKKALSVKEEVKKDLVTHVRDTKMDGAIREEESKKKLVKASERVLGPRPALGGGVAGWIAGRSDAEWGIDAGWFAERKKVARNLTSDPGDFSFLSDLNGKVYIRKKIDEISGDFLRHAEEG